MTPEKILAVAVKALDDKKALDISALSVTRLTTLADYFVICTGSSSTHMKTLADEAERRLKEEGQGAHHVEGYSTASWILLDYGGVLVHIFLKETREFYGLERLWSDAQRLDISGYLTEKTGDVAK